MNVQLNQGFVKIKVGNFEADMDMLCFGEVRIDGRPLHIKAFSIQCHVGQEPKIEFSFFPEVGYGQSGLPASSS